MNACWRLGLVPMLGLLFAAWLNAGDWPQFRGAGGAAISDEQGIPTQWSETQDLLWKADLPGPGASSPIIRNDRVYVTCYTGYGVSRDSTGSKSDLTRHLVCLEARSGKQIWSTSIKTDTPEANYSGQVTQHGYASNTPAIDDQRIYVFLGTGGVRAFDLEGNALWQAETGRGTNMWGSASSVVLTDDLVIVNAAIENHAVMAFDKATGNKAWQFDVPGRSWSTPALIKTAEGATEVVASVEGHVLGIDAKTGKELWNSEGIGDYTCPAVVPGQGVAYVCGGRRSQLLAVRAGNLEEGASRVIWQQRIGANVTTPVLHRGHLFGVSDQGIAYCVEAQSGKIVYQQRVGGEVRAAARPAAFQPDQPRRRGGRGGFGGGTQFYGSAIGLGEAVLAVSRRDGAFVISADTEYALIAHNRLAGDETNFDATPAVANGRLYLRSNRALYCIGK